MKKLLLITFLFSGVITLAFQEEEVSLRTDGCTLKGTLTTPDDTTNSSTLVILIAGSGPTDRNGNNPQMSNNSLKMLSAMIVDKGYSCLRYDKRGIAESKLDSLSIATASFDHFISDASAWVDQYASERRFNKVVLAGHSQGSLVAMIAANQNKNVDAVISLAGAGKPIHEILKWQLSNSLSVELQGVVDAKLDTLSKGDTLKKVPEFLANLFHPSVQPFLISWMKYDPAKQAKQLKVPFLIINGTTDLQVRVKEDAQALREAQPNAEYKIIKNMNHILKFTKEVEMGYQMELYSDPSVPLHKKLAKPIVSFLEELQN